MEDSLKVPFIRRNKYGTIGYGIFETDSGFRVEWRTERGVWSLCFGALSLVLMEFLFCQRESGGGHWAIIHWGLGTFLIFPNVLRS